MNHYLKQSYPFYYKGTSLFLISLIIFILSVAFSYFLEPFEVNKSEHKISYFWITVIHATVAIGVFIALSGFINLKKNIEHTWNVKREILFISAVLICIGIGQFLIRDIIYENPNNWSLRYLYEEIRNTFFVGFLFLLIITPLNIERLNKIYKQKALSINLNFGRKNLSNPNNEVFIKTNVKSDNFILNLNDFNYAKSDKNYIEFHLDNETILIKRISMKSLENVLSEYQYINKTHRSYLVNFNKIKDVKGNAQGYSLLLHNSDTLVPVSRAMIKLFEKKISILKS